MHRVKFTILATVALGFALATSTAMAQTTTFHDRAGRVTGKARIDANGTTGFYDATGRFTGRARTEANGNTTYYDAAGRVTGKASASRR